MEVPNKQLFRSVKYVWNKEWIGKEAFDAELKCAQQACLAEIIADYYLDKDTPPTKAQVELTALHVKKYGTSKVILNVDHCYTKVILEVYL